MNFFAKNFSVFWYLLLSEVRLRALMASPLTTPLNRLLGWQDNILEPVGILVMYMVISRWPTAFVYCGIQKGGLGPHSWVKKMTKKGEKSEEGDEIMKKFQRSQ